VRCRNGRCRSSGAGVDGVRNGTAVTESTGLYAGIFLGLIVRSVTFASSRSQRQCSVREVRIGQVGIAQSCAVG